MDKYQDENGGENTSRHAKQKPAAPGAGSKPLASWNGSTRVVNLRASLDQPAWGAGKRANAGPSNTIRGQGIKSKASKDLSSSSGPGQLSKSYGAQPSTIAACLQQQRARGADPAATKQLPRDGPPSKRACKAQDAVPEARCVQQGPPPGPHVCTAASIATSRPAVSDTVLTHFAKPVNTMPAHQVLGPSRIPKPVAYHPAPPSTDVPCTPPTRRLPGPSHDGHDAAMLVVNKSPLLQPGLAMTPPECQAMLDAVELAMHDVDTAGMGIDDSFEAWLARTSIPEPQALGRHLLVQLQDLFERARESCRLRALLEGMKADELALAEQQADDTLRHMDMLADENAELTQNQTQLAADNELLRSQLQQTQQELQQLLDAKRQLITAPVASANSPDTSSSDQGKGAMHEGLAPASPPHDVQAPSVTLPEDPPAWITMRRGPSAPSPHLARHNSLDAGFAAFGTDTSFEQIPEQSDSGVQSDATHEGGRFTAVGEVAGVRAQDGHVGGAQQGHWGQMGRANRVRRTWKLPASDDEGDADAATSAHGLDQSCTTPLQQSSMLVAQGLEGSSKSSHRKRQLPGSDEENVGRGSAGVAVAIKWPSVGAPWEDESSSSSHQSGPQPVPEQTDAATTAMPQAATVIGDIINGTPMSSQLHVNSADGPSVVQQLSDCDAGTPPKHLSLQHGPEIPLADCVQLGSSSRYGLQSAGSTTPPAPAFTQDTNTMLQATRLACTTPSIGLQSHPVTDCSSDSPAKVAPSPAASDGGSSSGSQHADVVVQQPWWSKKTASANPDCTPQSKPQQMQTAGAQQVIGTQMPACSHVGPTGVSASASNAGAPANKQDACFAPVSSTCTIWGVPAGVAAPPSVNKPQGPDFHEQPTSHASMAYQQGNAVASRSDISLLTHSPPSPLPFLAWAAAMTAPGESAGAAQGTVCASTGTAAVMPTMIPHSPSTSQANSVLLTPQSQHGSTGTSTAAAAATPSTPKLMMGQNTPVTAIGGCRNAAARLNQRDGSHYTPTPHQPARPFSPTDLSPPMTGMRYYAGSQCEGMTPHSLMLEGGHTPQVQSGVPQSGASRGSYPSHSDHPSISQTTKTHAANQLFAMWNKEWGADGEEEVESALVNGGPVESPDSCTSSMLRPLPADTTAVALTTGAGSMPVALHGHSQEVGVVSQQVADAAAANSTCSMGHVDTVEPTPCSALPGAHKQRMAEAPSGATPAMGVGPTCTPAAGLTGSPAGQPAWSGLTTLSKPQEPAMPYQDWAAAQQQVSSHSEADMVSSARQDGGVLPSTCSIADKAPLGTHCNTTPCSRLRRNTDVQRVQSAELIAAEGSTSCSQQASVPGMVSENEIACSLVTAHMAADEDLPQEQEAMSTPLPQAGISAAAVSTPAGKGEGAADAVEDGNTGAVSTSAVALSLCHTPSVAVAGAAATALPEHVAGAAVVHSIYSHNNNSGHASDVGGFTTPECGTCPAFATPTSSCAEFYTGRAAFSSAVASKSRSHLPPMTPWQQAHTATKNVITWPLGTGSDMGDETPRGNPAADASGSSPAAQQVAELPEAVASSSLSHQKHDPDTAQQQGSGQEQHEVLYAVAGATLTATHEAPAASRPETAEQVGSAGTTTLPPSNEVVDQVVEACSSNLQATMSQPASPANGRAPASSTAEAPSADVVQSPEPAAAHFLSADAHGDSNDAVVDCSAAAVNLDSSQQHVVNATPSPMHKLMQGGSPASSISLTARLQTLSPAVQSTSCTTEVCRVQSHPVACSLGSPVAEKSDAASARLPPARPSRAYWAPEIVLHHLSLTMEEEKHGSAICLVDDDTAQPAARQPDRVRVSSPSTNTAQFDAGMQAAGEGSAAASGADAGCHTPGSQPAPSSHHEGDMSAGEAKSMQLQAGPAADKTELQAFGDYLQARACPTPVATPISSTPKPASTACTPAASEPTSPQEASAAEQAVAVAEGHGNTERRHFSSFLQRMCNADMTPSPFSTSFSQSYAHEPDLGLEQSPALAGMCRPADPQSCSATPAKEQSESSFISSPAPAEPQAGAAKGESSGSSSEVTFTPPCTPGSLALAGHCSYTPLASTPSWPPASARTSGARHAGLSARCTGPTPQGTAAPASATDAVCGSATAGMSELCIEESRSEGSALQHVPGSPSAMPSAQCPPAVLSSPAPQLRRRVSMPDPPSLTPPPPPSSPASSSDKGSTRPSVYKGVVTPETCTSLFKDLVTPASFFSMPAASPTGSVSVKAITSQLFEQQHAAGKHEDDLHQQPTDSDTNPTADAENMARVAGNREAGLGCGAVAKQVGALQQASAVEPSPLPGNIRSHILQQLRAAQQQLDSVTGLLNYPSRGAAAAKAVQPACEGSNTQLQAGTRRVEHHPLPHSWREVATQGATPRHLLLTTPHAARTAQACTEADELQPLAHAAVLRSVVTHELVEQQDSQVNTQAHVNAEQKHSSQQGRSTSSAMLDCAVQTSPFPAVADQPLPAPPPAAPCIEDEHEVMAINHIVQSAGAVMGVDTCVALVAEQAEQAMAPSAADSQHMDMLPPAVDMQPASDVTATATEKTASAVETISTGAAMEAVVVVDEHSVLAEEDSFTFALPAWPMERPSSSNNSDGGRSSTRQALHNAQAGNLAAPPRVLVCARTRHVRLSTPEEQEVRRRAHALGVRISPYLRGAKTQGGAHSCASSSNN